jgi:hypothetical protein
VRHREKYGWGYRQVCWRGSGKFWEFLVASPSFEAGFGYVLKSKRAEQVRRLEKGWRICALQCVGTCLVFSKLKCPEWRSGEARRSEDAGDFVRYG